MPQSSNASQDVGLRQQIIGGMSLSQLLEMFQEQALAGDPLSVHLPEVWEWQYFLAVDGFLEQWKEKLPVDQLEQVKHATHFDAYLQWQANPDAARREIAVIRQDFLREFGPGE